MQPWPGSCIVSALPHLCRAQRCHPMTTQSSTAVAASELAQVAAHSGTTPAPEHPSRACCSLAPPVPAATPCTTSAPSQHLAVLAEPSQHLLPPLGGAKPQYLLLQTLANHIAAMVLLGTDGARVFTQAELLGVYAGGPAPAHARQKTLRALPKTSWGASLHTGRAAWQVCKEASTCFGNLAAPEAAPAATYHTATNIQCARALCKALAPRPQLAAQAQAADLRAPLPAMTCATALVAVSLKVIC